MEIIKQPKNYESCNFCTPSINPITYTHIYSIKSSRHNGGLVASVCPTCAEEFIEAIKATTND